MELIEKVIKAIDKMESSDRQLHPYELFGLETGLGWYGLILPLIKEIYEYNKQNPDKEITITQIKEKFGELRFYTNGEPEYIR
jgi:hypothetical protein